MSEHPIGTAKPCCMFLELASIASGPLLEDAKEDERIAEEEDSAAAAEEDARTSRVLRLLDVGQSMPLKYYCCYVWSGGLWHMVVAVCALAPKPLSGKMLL